MLTKWSLDSVLPSQASAHVASDQEARLPHVPPVTGRSPHTHFRCDRGSI